MDKISIANLTEIIEILKYPHICLHYDDVGAYTNIPWINKKYYKAHYKYSTGTVNGRRGFFNNGNTTVWEDWDLKPGHIKIATRLPSDPKTGWSDPFSF